MTVSLRRSGAKDAGMTLVELIVAGSISAMLLGLIATIFAQGLLAQQQQAVRNDATSQLNAVSSYINESMRSAVAANVSGTGSRLDLKVLKQKDDGSGFEYECRSWKISSGVLRYSGGTGPQGNDFADWSKLATGIVHPSGGPTPGFTRSGISVDYTLSIGDGDVEVTIRDGGYPGAKSTLVGGAACW